MSSSKARRIAGGVMGVVAGMALGLAAPASAVVQGPAFYINGITYRTVLTPTEISSTGAPAHAWDVIYEFSGAQLNVAEAAPGDVGYNGGRWMVHLLSFPDGYAAALADGDADGDGVLDSFAEVETALAAGSAVDEGVVKQFVCPVIPFPGNQRS